MRFSGGECREAARSYLGNRSEAEIDCRRQPEGWSEAISNPAGRFGGKSAEAIVVSSNEPLVGGHALRGPKDMEDSVEMKGRTGKGFPNREEDMRHVQTSWSVSREGLFDGKHVGIQGRSVVAAFFYTDSLFVFRRNRPVRTRTPGGVGFLLPTSSGHTNAVPLF